MWRRFSDYPLDAVAVGPVNAGIGVTLVEIADTILQKSSSSMRGRRSRSFDGTCDTTRVLDVEYPDFRITSSRYYSPVAGMGHEFDAEDVCTVAGGNGSSESKWGIGVSCLIGVDVDVLVIAAACKQVACLGPSSRY